MPISPTKPASAKIEHILVNYEGPQLALLRANNNAILIGYATFIEGYGYPLICCEPVDRYLDAYLRGKLELRVVFERTPKVRLYVVDVASTEADLPLKRVPTENYLPEHGIFSTVHTHPLVAGDTSKAYRQRFLIDGIWEARDFSRFHGRLADAYSLQSIARNLTEGTTSVLDEVFLKASISNREWQGGGSYLSFYGGVKEHLQSVHPLRVAAIEYHSPGYVEVEGSEEGLIEVANAIQKVISSRDDYMQIYGAIRKALRNEGLLAADKSMEFSAEVVRDYVLKQTDKLADMLGLPNSHLLLIACEKNVGVYAKLVLSYFRRINGIATFYLEGRARNPDAV